MLHKNRAFIFSNHSEPVRTVFVQWDSHEQVAKRGQRRIAARDFQPCRSTAFLNDIDDAQVCEISDGKAADVFECFVVVEGRTEDSTYFSKKRLFGFEPLLICDVKFYSRHALGQAGFIVCEYFSDRQNPDP